MLRTRHLAGAFLASTCLTTPALAQTTTLPPQRVQIDANGVDRAGGEVLLQQPELSIGPSGPGGLAVVGYQSVSPTNGQNNNWNLVLFAQGTTYSAGLGLTGDGFSRSGSTFTSLAQNGSTLSLSGTTYTYVNSDGVKIIYQVGPTATDAGAIVARASQVIYPTGEIDTLVWNSVTYCTNGQDNCQGGTYQTRVRLQSVTSSTGYRLQYTYALNSTPTSAANGVLWSTLQKITAINLGVDYCDPTANSCSGLTQTWPTVSFVVTGPTVVGGNTVVNTDKVTDALGRATLYTWKQIVGTSGTTYTFAVRRPSSTTDNITYSLPGGTTPTQVVKDGQTWAYALSTSGNILTVTSTDPLGHTITTTADTTIQQLTSYVDHPQTGVTRTTTYAYDAGGNLTKATAPEGNYTQYAHDGRGNVTSTTLVSKTPGTPANIVTSAIYPTTCTNPVTCNKPTSTTDANGKATTYTYDPTHGGVLTVTQPAVGGISPQTRYTYSTLQAYYKNSGGSIAASGVATYRLSNVSACQTTANCAVGSADEVKSTISYGPQVAGTANNLLPISVSSGSGNGTLTATKGAGYDIIGNLTTSMDPLGHVTTTLYDADREVTEIISPDPDGAGVLKNRAQRFTYSLDGLVTLTEQGTSAVDGSSFATLQQVATGYDSADRKIQDSAQAGGTTYAVVQYGYDAASRLQCTAQRMNPSTFGALPASACTLATTGSYGPDRITFNTYDNADELTKVTTGYGVTTANGFPATLQRDETTYTWSNNSKLKTLADAKNNLTTYVYDGFDRLSQTQYPSPTTPGSSNAADYEQLGYDAAGNVTGRRLRGSTLAAGGYDISYGYDALERLSSKTLPSPEHGVTYAYDNFGQPATITGATTLSYVFDALGRETSETQAYGSVAYQYDLANRRTRLTWQDGTYLTYDYDNADEMSDIKESGSTVLAGFTYDDLGERKTRTLANGTSTAYGYDPISRLTSLALAGGTNTNTATLSNYSPAGEIGAHANSNDAFAWIAGITGSRAYTINGLNQFATVAGATQGYDARGNLTSSGGVTYAYTSENLLKTVSTGQTLVYDPIGRLHEYDAPTATRFVYDGGMISEEFNTSGAIQRRYVFGPAGDEPIVWYEGSGTTTKRYMDQDERGSITRITDASGATVAVNSYDEYGIPGANNQGRFGYTGQAWLSEIGLAYYKARIYSPTLGRFLQTDPIGYGDGPNWYNYVGSDPINGIDPLGLACVLNLVNGAWIKHCNSQDGASGSVQNKGLGTPPSQGGPPLAKPQSANGEIVVTAKKQLAQEIIEPFPFPFFEEPPIVPDDPVPYPTDPTKAPGPDWVWRGRPGSKPGDKSGNWYNPNTGESLRPDLQHPPGIDPHWDYKAPDGSWYRWFGPGNMAPKSIVGRLIA
jgi:RHS repeat-associated protein